MISLEDFKRIDLRVGTIVSAQKLPDAASLLRVEVNLGDERRTLVAALARHYQPESLLGLAVVVVANLTPAVIHGIESQGMLLGVGCHGSAPALLTVNHPVPEGSAVQ